MEKMFNLEKINNISDKFTERIGQAQAEIDRLTNEYSRLESDLDTAIEADILEGSAKTVKEVQNLSGRLQNVKGQFDIQIKTLEKCKELRANAVAGAVREYRQCYTANMIEYQNKVERPIFEELKALKEKQYELLMRLLAERNAVVNTLGEFDSICYDNGMDNLMTKASLEMWQNNLTLPSTHCPELGSPLLNAVHLQHLQAMYERQNAEANARIIQDERRMNRE